LEVFSKAKYLTSIALIILGNNVDGME